MIDINELRRLAQAALAGPDGISMNWIKLIQDFQQKAGPATILELLDRLEAAETAWRESDKTCRDLTEKVIPNIREKLEAAEKSGAESLAMYRKARDERDALRAKIEAMEKRNERP